MDTQRRDRMGCYGYGRDTTPNLTPSPRAACASTTPTPRPAGPGPPRHCTRVFRPTPTACGARRRTLSQRFVTLAEASGGAAPLRRCGQSDRRAGPLRPGLRDLPRGQDRSAQPSACRKRSPKALDWIDQHAPCASTCTWWTAYAPPAAPRGGRAARCRGRRTGRSAGWTVFAMTPTPTPETSQYVSDLTTRASRRAIGGWGRARPARRARADRIDRRLLHLDHGEELFDHGDHGHGHDVWSELVRAPPFSPVRGSRGTCGSGS